MDSDSDGPIDSSVVGRSDERRDGRRARAVGHYNRYNLRNRLEQQHHEVIENFLEISPNSRARWP
jgi:hypothetical protein